MKKKMLTFFTALCVLLSVIPAFATEQRVFDNADLLSEAEEQEMQVWAEELQENWGMDLAFLTTNDTEGKSVQQYGADFFVAHDLGLGENDDGVIFVLDMGSREGQIITSGKAIDIYTDYYINRMWEDMVDNLSDGAYYDAMFSLYRNLDTLAKEYEEYQADPDAFLSDYAKEQKTKSLLMFTGISVLFALAVAAIAVNRMRKNAKNVTPYTDGRAYLKENGYHLSVNRDSFASTHTTFVPIPKNDDDTHHSSWGGGSSTFTGGGGHTFGGGGGKF